MFVAAAIAMYLGVKREDLVKPVKKEDRRGSFPREHDGDGRGPSHVPATPAASQPRAAPRAIRVWDLPTRLFHWLLAGLVIFSFVTAKVGGAWVDWHFYSGYAILALLVFRLLWGFTGNRYARFASFVRGPRAVMAYVRGGATFPGHSPLGALSVLLLLAALLLQAVTGLFTGDDIASEGPLLKLVSSEAGSLLARVHRWNEKVLIALGLLHVAAVVFYQWARGRDLIGPMLSGDQRHAGLPGRHDALLRWRAVVLFAFAAGLVGWIVNL